MDEQKEVIICDQCKRPILNKDELVVLAGTNLIEDILSFKHKTCLPYSKLLKKYTPYTYKDNAYHLRGPGIPAVNSKLYIPVVTIYYLT